MKRDSFFCYFYSKIDKLSLFFQEILNREHILFAVFLRKKKCNFFAAFDSKLQDIFFKIEYQNFWDIPNIKSKVIRTADSLKRILLPHI